MRGQQELLDSAVLALNYGVKYGLVGRNGVGKTTLLRQLSEGIIALPKFLNVVHVEQEVTGDHRSALATIVVTGVVALATAPRADVDFAELGSSATCLRAGRRADAAVVYLDVGSPLQSLTLLLDLGTVTGLYGGDESLCKERVAEFLDWLMAREEREIAVVAHKHTLKYLLALVADDDALTTVMSNAELRSLNVCSNRD